MFWHCWLGSIHGFWTVYDLLPIVVLCPLMWSVKTGVNVVSHCVAEGDQSAENDVGATLWAASSRLILCIHVVVKWTLAWHGPCGSWLKGLEEEGENLSVSLLQIVFVLIDYSCFMQQNAVVYSVTAFLVNLEMLGNWPKCWGNGRDLVRENSPLLTLSLGLGQCS